MVCEPHQYILQKLGKDYIDMMQQAAYTDTRISYLTRKPDTMNSLDISQGLYQPRTSSIDSVVSSIRPVNLVPIKLPLPNVSAYTIPTTIPYQKQDVQQNTLDTAVNQTAEMSLLTVKNPAFLMPALTNLKNYDLPLNAQYQNQKPVDSNDLKDKIAEALTQLEQQEVQTNVLHH